MSSVKDKLLKGTAWLGMASLLVNALALLSTFALARLLSPADFGLVALGTTLMLIVSEITELSLAQALVRHADPTREHFDTAWTLNALRGGVLAASFAGAAIPVAHAYGDDRLVGIMLALGCSIFLGGLSNPRRILFTRRLIFWQEFLLNVGQKLAGVVASIAVAYIYQSYWALVVGILASQVVNLVISYMVLPYLPRIRFTYTKELFSFSAWLTAARIVDTLNWRFDTLFAGKILGPVALGHYSFGGTLAAIPTRETTNPLRQTFFPAFASMRDDNERMAAAYQRGQAVLTAVAMPAGLGAALIADPLIRLVMGEKWAPAIFIVQTLAAVFAVQTMGSTVDSVCMAKGQTRLMFIRGLQLLAVRVPAIVIATLSFGIVGLVGARAFTGLLTTYVNMRMARTLIGLSLISQVQANMRAFASSAAMVGVGISIAAFFFNATLQHGLLAEILSVGASATAAYMLTSAVIWHAQGRPTGPEKEFGDLIMKAFRKFGKRSL